MHVSRDGIMEKTPRYLNNIPRLRMIELDGQINKYKWINRLGVFLIIFPLSIILVLYVYEYLDPSYSADWLYISFPSLISSIIGYYIVKYSGPYVEKLRLVRFLLKNLKLSYALSPTAYKGFSREISGFIINNKILCIVHHVEKGKLTLGFVPISSAETIDYKIINNINAMIKRKKIKRIQEFRTKESIVNLYSWRRDKEEIIVAKYYNLRYKKDLLMLIRKTIKYVMEKTSKDHFL